MTEFKFEIGQRVYHKSFGGGVVVERNTYDYNTYVYNTYVVKLDKLGNMTCQEYNLVDALAHEHNVRMSQSANYFCIYD